MSRISFFTITRQLNVRRVLYDEVYWDIQCQRLISYISYMTNFVGDSENIVLLKSQQRKRDEKCFFYQSPIFCACSNFFHPNHDFVLSLVQKECLEAYVIEKSGMEISIPDFYSRFFRNTGFYVSNIYSKNCYTYR